MAVILMDGATVFATNNTDLWNGSAARPDVAGVFMAPYLNEEGVEPASDASIFTGSTQAGVKGTDGRELGGSAEVPPKVTTGLKRPNNANRWMVQFNSAATSSLRFFALSAPLKVSAVGGGNTFAAWIAGYPGVGTFTSLGDDADNDGNDNGVENFFGTDPSAFSGGLVAGAVAGNTFTFTHPQIATPASDLAAAYVWSKDLGHRHRHRQAVCENPGDRELIDPYIEFNAATLAAHRYAPSTPGSVIGALGNKDCRPAPFFILSHTSIQVLL